MRRCEDCGGSGVDPGSLYDPQPCDACFGSGYEPLPEWRAITCEEALELSAAADRVYNLMTPAECAGSEESMSEIRAEQLAESGWLRAAENAGWREAWHESLIESGVRTR